MSSGNAAVDRALAELDRAVGTRNQQDRRFLDEINRELNQILDNLQLCAAAVDSGDASVRDYNYLITELTRLAGVIRDSPMNEAEKTRILDRIRRQSASGDIRRNGPPSGYSASGEIREDHFAAPDGASAGLLDSLDSVRHDFTGDYGVGSKPVISARTSADVGLQDPPGVDASVSMGKKRGDIFEDADLEPDVHKGMRWNKYLKAWEPDPSKKGGKSKKKRRTQKKYKKKTRR